MRIISALTTLAMLLIPTPPAFGAGVQQTTNIINDCVKRSNSFKKTFDHALAQPNVRAGNQREQDLNQSAANLASQMDKVGDSWNRDHSLDKAGIHVTGAISQANNVNRAMRTWRMGSDCESQWAALRSELNRLAATFNVPGVR